MYLPLALDHLFTLNNTILLLILVYYVCINVDALFQVSIKEESIPQC